jgi:hypothetical protein
VGQPCTIFRRWPEQSEDFQPGFRDDRDPGRSDEVQAAPGRQAYSTLVYKLGQAAGGFARPVLPLVHAILPPPYSSPPSVLLLRGGLCGGKREGDAKADLEGADP